MTNRVRQNKQYWIAYCRCASARVGDSSESLAIQEKLCKAFFAQLSPQEKSGKPLKIIKEVGTHSTKRLFDMIDQQEVYGLIATEPSRISRSVYEIAYLLNQQQYNKIRMHFVSETTNWWFHLFQAIKTFEKTAHSQATKRGMAAAKEQRGY